MSVQTRDELIYNEKSYGINHIEQEFPFSLQDHNLNPVRVSTANYRGFMAGYKILAHKLHLDELSIREATGSNTAAKVVYGILPTPDPYDAIGFVYVNINTLIPYTGIIYADYEYHKPGTDLFSPSFKHVEFEFVKGELVRFEECD